MTAAQAMVLAEALRPPDKPGSKPALKDQPHVSRQRLKEIARRRDPAVRTVQGD